MKIPLWLQFIAGVVVVLLIAAFIAPFISQFIAYDYDRILSRTVMVMFIFLVILFLIKGGGLDFKYYGLEWQKGSGFNFLRAFLLGFLTLLFMNIIEITLGVRTWQFTFHQTIWPLKILKYIGSALVIGTLEEFIFRGLLFRTLEKKVRLVPALILTNILYSIAHFLRYSGKEVISDPGFMTSLRLYGEILRPLTEISKIWPDALGLFLFGLVLSYAYLRTGRDLIFPIGLHAGAVFFLKIDRWFIHIESEAQKIWFGGSQFHGCILGWVMILLIAIAIRLTVKNNKPS
jgi:membrane protease YdiL (CAAX protease family)